MSRRGEYEELRTLAGEGLPEGVKVSIERKKGQAPMKAADYLSEGLRINLVATAVEHKINLDLRGAAEATAMRMLARQERELEACYARIHTLERTQGGSAELSARVVTLEAENERLLGELEPLRQNANESGALMLLAPVAASLVDAWKTSKGGGLPDTRGLYDALNKLGGRDFVLAYLADFTDLVGRMTAPPEVCSDSPQTVE